MAYIKTYKELVVWQKSMILVKEIYALLETQIIISKDLKLANPQEFVKSVLLLEEVLKMLHSMLYTIKARQLDAKRSKN